MIPCYLCLGFGAGGPDSDCLKLGGGLRACGCCGGRGHHDGSLPERCARAQRNAMGKECSRCGALWDEECECALTGALPERSLWDVSGG